MSGISPGKFTSTSQGEVPASGGGTTNFMRADGSWSVPPGSGGSGITQLTGDVTAGPGSGSVVATLANTPVTPASYINANITVDAKGRIIAASNGSGGGGTTGSAPTLRGTQKANGSGASLVLPLPAGTIAGDFAVMFYEGGYGPTWASNTTLAMNFKNVPTSANAVCFTKIITAGDVTAGNITIPLDGSFANCGAIATFVGNCQIVTGFLESNTATGGVNGVPFALKSWLQTGDIILGCGMGRGASTIVITGGTQQQTINAANSSLTLNSLVIANTAPQIMIPSNIVSANEYLFFMLAVRSFP